MSLLFVFVGSVHAGDAQHISVEVTKRGFVPDVLNVAAGTNVILDVTRTTDNTCATEIQVPEKNIKKTKLPLNKTVSIPLGKLAKGEIKFGCGMHMMAAGKIFVK